jgi:hypothetical protein
MVMLAGLALGGCAASGGAGADLGAMQVKEPMTHTKAAELCWMSTEKTSARLPLDKRADLVERCIAEKMGTAPPKAEPEKKKTASAADGKHRMPVINGNKKKKPAVAEAKKKPAAEKKPDENPKDKKPADAQKP